MISPRVSKPLLAQLPPQFPWEVTTLTEAQNAFVDLHQIAENQTESLSCGWSFPAGLLSSQAAQLPVDSPSPPCCEEHILRACTRLTLCLLKGHCQGSRECVMQCWQLSARGGFFFFFPVQLSCMARSRGKLTSLYHEECCKDMAEKLRRLSSCPLTRTLF